MITTRILKHAIIAVSLTTLTACGGGGGGGDNNTGSNTGETPEKIIPRGSSGDSATLDQTTYTGEKLAAFNALNAARAAAGLPLAKQNTRLDQAAQAHADYMAKNKRGEGHNETEGVQGFTGKNPWDRANHVGYSNWQNVGEGMGPGNAAEEAMIALIRVPYHRISAFHPGLTDIGYGITVHYEAGTTNVDSTSLIVNYGYAPEPQPITAGYFVWPADQATDVLTIMGAEAPDPAPDLAFNMRGYPVSVTTDPGDKITIDVFKINCAGNDLTARIITADNDINKRLTSNWVFLLTETALPSNTTCSVTFQGSSPALGSFNKTWSFTTMQ